MILNLIIPHICSSRSNSGLQPRHEISKKFWIIIIQPQATFCAFCTVKVLIMMVQMARWGQVCSQDAYAAAHTPGRSGRAQTQTPFAGFHPHLPLSPLFPDPHTYLPSIMEHSSLLTHLLGRVLTFIDFGSACNILSTIQFCPSRDSFFTTNNVYI